MSYSFEWDGINLIYVNNGKRQHIFYCVLHNNTNVGLLIPNHAVFATSRDNLTYDYSKLDPSDVPYRIVGGANQTPNMQRLILKYEPLIWTTSVPDKISGVNTKDFDLKNRVGVGDTTQQLRYKKRQLYYIPDLTQKEEELIGIWEFMTSKAAPLVGSPGLPPGFGP